jgi:hypothetical protein
LAARTQTSRSDARADPCEGRQHHQRQQEEACDVAPRAGVADALLLEIEHHNLQECSDRPSHEGRDSRASDHQQRQRRGSAAGATAVRGTLADTGPGDFRYALLVSPHRGQLSAERCPFRRCGCKQQP